MKRWQAILPLAALVGLGTLGAIQLMRPAEDSSPPRPTALRRPRSSRC
jgi:hypothetical protein